MAMAEEGTEVSVVAEAVGVVRVGSGTLPRQSFLPDCSAAQEER